MRVNNYACRILAQAGHQRRSMPASMDEDPPSCRAFASASPVWSSSGLVTRCPNSQICRIGARWRRSRALGGGAALWRRHAVSGTGRRCGRLDATTGTRMEENFNQCMVVRSSIFESWDGAGVIFLLL